ncbi:helix-turn-helix domain-containing protein [Streptomyces sp. NPDC057555]|uniref:helix-turn-helix domain-containing protein n=1 Tax=Streptomyces sp. NPDC057555 TaxID=3346166 RepID=UPI00367A8369
MGLACPSRFRIGGVPAAGRLIDEAGVPGGSGGAQRFAGHRGRPVVQGLPSVGLHEWAEYAAGGFEGLREASCRPRTRPIKLPADLEALVCEMRRSHPCWGARRIAYEIERTGSEACSVAGHCSPGPGPQRSYASAGKAASAHELPRVS